MPDSILRQFFDTNVILYLESQDARKHRIAEELIEEGGTISVQVLNEVANVASRKMAMSSMEIRRLLSRLRQLLRVVPLTEQVHDDGLRLLERYKLGVFDAMIVAAALSDRCDVVLSEDMQHNLLIDGRLRIINPFRSPD